MNNNINTTTGPMPDTERRRLLKERFADLKKRMPRSWRSEFLQKHPQYKSDTWKFRLTNIYNLVGSDEQITNLLEKMYPIQTPTENGK
jgi:hypothetical protein